MCTAFSFQNKEHYFCRNLDLDCSYGEQICILPRNYALMTATTAPIQTHYALLGMATVIDAQPLFYDGVNEHGLAMAGLNFPNNAHYAPRQNGKDNVPPYAFIPWVLAQCKTVKEAKKVLKNVNLVNVPFSNEVPLAPLHWLIADNVESITVEPMQSGLQVYENPVGVLTNNPPFDFHLQNLKNYKHLRADNGVHAFGKGIAPEAYCQGLGAVGLPGDVSSPSRFVRAVFHLRNSVCEKDENSSISQAFHLLGSVEMVQGCCRTDSGKNDVTVYSACMNTGKGLYYYTTYNNRQITCVDMRKTNLNGKNFFAFPLRLTGDIIYQN